MDDLLSKIDDAYTLRLLAEMIAIDSVVGHEEALARYLHGELAAQQDERAGEPK